MITLLGNRYQIVREIGAGGMGRVFQAVDTQTGRAVAAKVMLAGRDESLDALLRFYQEGAVLSTLKHPNIVEVYGTYLEEGNCSIIMELLEGPSLADLMQSETLTLGRVSVLGGQIAAGLGYAHQRGIVHRDVKPSNVMVVGGDRVKVTDFGIARVPRGGTFQTASGVSLGTPLYMSPEQIEGGKIDARSDIYSLGVVLYQMVAGRPPFEGSDPLSIAFKHVHRQAPPPSEFNPNVPADWEQLILQMLAKDPAGRIQTAAQVVEAIAGLTRSESDAFAGSTPLESEMSRESPVRDAPVTATIPRAESVKTTPPDAEAMGEGTAVAAAPTVAKPAPRRTLPWPLLAGVAVLAAAVVAGLLVYNGQSKASHLTAGTFLLQAGPFADPEGITVDGHGNIYLAVWGENKVVKLSPAGKMLAAWGSKGAGHGQFNGPTGITVDASGDIYVADSGNNRIEELSSSGAWLATLGGGKAGAQRGQFAGLHSLEVDRHGTIYATDYGNNRIVKLTPGEFVTGIFGGPGPGSGRGQFDQPVGLALDSAGNIYVADFNNSRIVKLTSDGRFVTQFTRFGINGSVRPHGVAVDAHGNIYIADYQNNMIEVLAPSGTPLHHWGGKGAAHGQVNRPVAVWVDAQGNVYVADSGNNRIQKFAPVR